MINLIDEIVEKNNYEILIKHLAKFEYPNLDENDLDEIFTRYMNNDCCTMIFDLKGVIEEYLDESAG